jgi:hypothetical protein
MKRGELLVGFVVGLLPLGIAEIGYNLYLSANIQRCMQEACASAGLPPGCNVGDFGCNEWSGLARALVFIAGLLCLVLYAVIVGVMAYLMRRKANKAAGRGISTQAGG